MSSELQEDHGDHTLQFQARCRGKGQFGNSELEKCCHNHEAISSKRRTNPTQFQSSINYLKRLTGQNLKPINLKQQTYRKGVHRQWKESRQRKSLEQRQESTPWKEGSMQWEELTQANEKEHDELLVQLGCGEELAHGNESDWQLGLEEGEEFVLVERNGSLNPLVESNSEKEEETQGVVGQLHRGKQRKTRYEVQVSGKTRMPKPVNDHLSVNSSMFTLNKPIVHKDGINKHITCTPLKISEEVFTPQMFSNGFYSNQIHTNGINTDEFSPDRTDIVTMFPDVCDAGEALADAEGVLECDLFENFEQSWPAQIKELGDHRDTVMLSESLSVSLSTCGEEAGEAAEETDQKQEMENSSPLFGNSQDSFNSDSTIYPKSEREAGILSEFSPHPSTSFSSLCSSESEVTSDEVERTETGKNPRNGQECSETEQAGSRGATASALRTTELETPCVSSEIPPQPKGPKSQKEKQCDGQEDAKSERSDCQIEEHVYEETEPTFQTKDFLQSRRYLMTRSISMEPTNSIPDPLPSTALRKERLMLHPQSYYTRHFLGENLHARTGSLGCLSPGRPCAPTMDIPPPFELSSITKRPIRKSKPALPNDVPACSRKLDTGFKRYFLPLRFLRKTERRTDSRSVSSRSSSESSPHGSCKRLNAIRQCTDSPELQRTQFCSVPSSPSTFHFQKNAQREGICTPFNYNAVPSVPSSWDMLGMEPDDLVHSLLVQPLTLSKPRSFSSPNVDSSVYENILNRSPHYENVHVRLLTPSNLSNKNQSPADTDGYVDMSCLPGFKRESPSSEQETESAYTICSPTVRSDGTVSVSVHVGSATEEVKNAPRRLTVNCSRAFYTVKELLDSETQHVKTLKLLNETVHADEQLIQLWNDVPVIYTLHRDLHTQLESRIKEWDQNERIADIILAKKAGFSIFFSFISHHDSRMKTTEQMESREWNISTLKQQLLQVVVRVLQYRMLLTDYMTNLSLHSKEYEDTQEALVMFSGVSDQAKECLKNGMDLLRLVHIEHNVQGLKNLLQSGRVFVKEGTLMKVSRKCRQPRHLFLMSDMMLYTYPQQDGKYRLINTLALTGMEVSKVLIENTQNALKIEVKDTSITLSASSSIERDDWFVTLNRTIADLGSVLAAPTVNFELGEKSAASLGENAPSLLSISQVSVCMNCPVHFSLTHRRHHCHACGKVVCRDCCRNKVPLKYMKNRRAKVCDNCYSQLCKNGDVIMLEESCSRPKSVVFHNIHPTSLWKSRKGHVSFTQVTGSEGEMSGTLQRSRNSKRSWKSLWFLLKDKVLYTYPQPEERVACETLPLLGFSVRSENESGSSVFQLYHNTTLYYTFKAQDTHTAQRWVCAMEEATVL